MAQMTRRNLLRRAAAAGTGLAAPAILRGGRGANEKLQIAHIGMGKRASQVLIEHINSNHMRSHCRSVALCDPWERAGFSSWGTPCRSLNRLPTRLSPSVQRQRPDRMARSGAQGQTGQVSRGLQGPANSLAEPLACLRRRNPLRQQRCHPRAAPLDERQFRRLRPEAGIPLPRPEAGQQWHLPARRRGDADRLDGRAPWLRLSAELLHRLLGAGGDAQGLPACPACGRASRPLEHDDHQSEGRPPHR